MDASNKSFIYTGSIIHSLSLNQTEYITDGLIVVSKGKVVLLNHDSNELTKIQKDFKVVDKNIYKLAKGQFLIPGFIDTHIHGPQYPNIGLGYDLPLLQWLEKYTFPLETKFKNDEFAEKVYNAVVKKTLANGTTTACYYATIHKSASLILANCVKNQGQRAFIGKVNMNKNTPPDYGESFEESLEATRAFVEGVMALKSDLVKPIITPRFALSCDMKLMKALGKLADDLKLPIQTHVSENVEEVEIVKREYSDHLNYVDVYQKAGLINKKTILAHGIYLEEDEVHILKIAKATICHCPSSNILLQSGLCPVRRYLSGGLKVSLGTDCSGGSSCSMLDCIRQALTMSVLASFNGLGEKLTQEEVFYLATLGGAEALELDKITGNFTVGKDFDAILVDLNNTDVLDLLEEYNLNQLFQKFLYVGDDRVMTKVFVAGNAVKEL